MEWDKLYHTVNKQMFNRKKKTVLSNIRASVNANCVLSVQLFNLEVYCCAVCYSAVVLEVHRQAVSLCGHGRAV